MIIRELTEQEKKEAVSFMEGVAQMTYDEFNNWKKSNSGYATYLLNWCRIRNDYPELNKIWEEKFVKPDREKRYEANKNNILAEMSKKKMGFIKEHLIPDDVVTNTDSITKEKTFRYRLIHHSITANDECLMLAIPYDAANLIVPKFGASVEIYKSQNPEFFEEILRTYKRYDGTPICSSNAEKYNKRF